MHDVFGEEIRLWHFIEEKIKKILGDFGFSEVRTPVLEKIEVFKETVGDETDIVEKQMYAIEKESETLVLRPEGTASFMRAVLEHGLHKQGGTGRYYYYEPMFRHERPQKGRLRQFHQFGAEIINDASPEADAELITVLDQIYRAFHITEYEVRINSVGCQDCRPVYKEALKKFFQPKLSSLCELCQKRFERAPMRILDCKRDSCQAIAKGAPVITDSLDEKCKMHHETLRKRLKETNVAYIDDPHIVRGLDYYSRTAFEFTSNLLGAQSALGGGGRYDLLATRFGEKEVPAVGWGLGMERLVIALETRKDIALPSENPVFYFASLGAKAFDTLFPLSLQLKRDGVRNEMTYDPAKSLKSQLKQADKSGAKYTVVLGEDELNQKQFLLKEMATGKQEALPLADLRKELSRRISAH